MVVPSTSLLPLLFSVGGQNYDLEKRITAVSLYGVVHAMDSS